MAEDEYGGPDRRKETCDGCVKDAVNKMIGTLGTNTWLLRVLLLGALASTIYNHSTVSAFAKTESDQATQIALNTAAIQELKLLAKQNITDHRDMQDKRDEQTRLILNAIGELR